MPALDPIQVSTSRRYFVTAGGDSFLFIGANDSISWQGLEGLHRRRNLPAADRYLDDLAEHGITVLRLMLEYAHHDGWYFEQPVGQFNPIMIQLWDDLIARCQARGLRILLTPWDSFWMSRRWQHHPYNRISGGPASQPGDFFTNPQVIQAAVNRLCFVVERWGETGVIAAWDLFNEIHPYWGGTPAEQSRVLTQISEQVREFEQRRWGFTRPQTVSCFGPNPDQENAEMIFRHPDLDFATTHIYYKGAIDYPSNTTTSAVAMAQWVQYGVQAAADRPFTDSEHGPIHLFNDHEQALNEPFDDEYERRLMWAHLAAGGAGSGMRWPARDPHILTTGMKASLLSLSKFAGYVDWNTFRPAALNDWVETGKSRIRIIGSVDDRQAVLWLMHPATRKNREEDTPRPRMYTDLSVTVPGLIPGAYSVYLWDTVRGCLERSTTAQVEPGEPLHLPLPQFTSDTAIAVRRA